MKPVLKMKLLSMLIVPAISVPFALSATAAETTKSTQSSAADTNAARQAFHDLRASKLIGKDITNPQGQSLGEVKDLILSLNNDRVYYAIIEFGGFLGFGEKLFAYPMSAFKTSAGDDKLVLDVPREKLQSAPGFARDTWPDWITYSDAVDRYFGTNEEARAAGQKLLRASEVIGKDVRDRSGTDVGEIDDIVVNMKNGNIHYVVLDFDASFGPDNKLLALPTKAFSFSTHDDELVLNVPKERLDMARAFDENRWPNLNDPVYLIDIDRYLVLVPVTPAGSGAGTSGTAGTSGMSGTAAGTGGGGTTGSDRGAGASNPSSGASSTERNPR